MLYRVLRDMTTGHRAGDVVDGGRFKHLTALLQHGALAPVHAPPLAMLPGWGERWQALPPELRTIEALIAAPAVDIAAACGVDAPTAALWQVEALEFLKPKNCKCRR